MSTFSMMAPDSANCSYMFDLCLVQTKIKHFKFDGPTKSKKNDTNFTLAVVFENASSGIVCA